MKKRVGFTIALAFAFGMASESVLAQWETVWQLGAPLRGWPGDGVGGGPDVDFVQETGVNPPPGDPNSPAVNQQADDDYYFAGEYPAPIGAVANDEIAMERAFAGSDNDLRIHFNLSEDLSPGSEIRFSLESNNLHEGGGADPRYGVEVLFNGVLIAPERIVRPAELNTVFTSDPVTLSDVNAVFGPGGDNVLHLRGINLNNDGGGNWMGLDYHELEVKAAVSAEVPALSDLGLLALALALIPIGTFIIRRRRAATA